MNKEIYRLCQLYVKECNYQQTDGYKGERKKLGFKAVILDELRRELKQK